MGGNFSLTGLSDKPREVVGLFQRAINFKVTLRCKDCNVRTQFVYESPDRVPKYCVFCGHEAMEMP